MESNTTITIRVEMTLTMKELIALSGLTIGYDLLSCGINGKMGESYDTVSIVVEKTIEEG